MRKIQYYGDVCTVNIYTRNEYGTPILEDSGEVRCMFNWTIGTQHSNNVDYTNTDATAYLDIDSQFIIKWKYRLEGQYIVFSRHGEEQWYKITKVVIGISLLTNNEENNVFCLLSKSEPQEAIIPEVPEESDEIDSDENIGGGNEGEIEPPIVETRRIQYNPFAPPGFYDD